ncbi:MAG TPA: response regulator [Thermoanaerobaculia bacterium]|nr:response regulator [Thermoanaerobaculia bacterium]
MAIAHTGKGKILIIDDSEAALTSARRSLESAGYTVITSNTALRMPALVQQESPELILLDVEMPALRGDQVMEFTQLFDFLRRSPIVFHSAKPEEELAELVKKTGAAGFIRKTSNSLQFVNQVDRWMTKARSEKSAGPKV